MSHKPIDLLYEYRMIDSCAGVLSTPLKRCADTAPSLSVMVHSSLPGFYGEQMGSPKTGKWGSLGKYEYVCRRVTEANITNHSPASISA